MSYAKLDEILLFIPLEAFLPIPWEGKGVDYMVFAFFIGGTNFMWFDQPHFLKNANPIYKGQ